jgi:hypothetical protein
MFLLKVNKLSKASHMGKGFYKLVGHCCYLLVFIDVDSCDLINSNCVAVRRLLTNQTYILTQAVDCIVMIVNYPLLHITPDVLSRITALFKGCSSGAWRPDFYQLSATPQRRGPQHTVICNGAPQ